MQGFHFFINDLSHPFQDFDRPQKLGCVLNLIEVLWRVKKTAKGEIAVVSNVPLPRCDLGNGDHMGSLLQGGDYRDEWRRLLEIEDKNTFEGEIFHLTSETRYKGTFSNAMNWVWHLDTAIISFLSVDDWKAFQLPVEVSEVSEVAGEHEVGLFTQDVNLRNISSLEHCEHWRTFLTGGVDAKSAQVYNCEDFTIKMYLRDHRPPHIHVFENGNAAVISLEKCNVMQGSISGHKLKQVADLVNNNRDIFNENWGLCREGKLPKLIP